MIRKLLLSFIVTVFLMQANAADSLSITLNNTHFKSLDTISFTCIVPQGLHNKNQIATLNVYIENINSKQQKWQYRYPVINGEAAADLIISNQIPEGKYAVNFVLQNQFLSVEGTVKDYKPKQSFLSYLVLGKYETHYFDITVPEPNGNFRLKNLLFIDTAYFVFTPAKKKTIDYLWIDLKSSLDSAFIPAAITTQYITIGSADTNTPPLKQYQFELNNAIKQRNTLPDVIVQSKKKKLIDKFNEEYSTGIFARSPLQVFDGLDNTEIANSYNIFEFLKGKIPGLTVSNNEGMYHLNWRNAGVDLYLDEFAFPINSDDYINPSDIAMIKVFPPPSNIGTNPRSATIAIYTKKGAYNVNPNRKNKFKITGYTAAEFLWR